MGEPNFMTRLSSHLCRVAAVCVKRKNPINTPLFAARPPGLEDLNPYALIIAEEALRRGIRVEVTDSEWGELRLSVGGRTVSSERRVRPALQALGTEGGSLPAARGAANPSAGPLRRSPSSAPVGPARE